MTPEQLAEARRICDAATPDDVPPRLRGPGQVGMSVTLSDGETIETITSQQKTSRCCPCCGRRLRG